jgi:hypothetical protein
MSTSQLSIFDAPVVPFSRSASRIVDHETTGEAIARCHTDPLWTSEALRITKEMCQNRMEWDLDDLAEALKPIDHLEHEKRAVGQITKTAKAQNWCRQSRVEKSKRPSRHSGYIAVYESLIFLPSEC